MSCKNEKKRCIVSRITTFLTIVILAFTLTSCSNEDGNKKLGGRYAIPLGTASPEDTVTQIYAESFAKEVEAKSNGRIKIDVYANSVLGGDRELFESCYDGDIPFVVQNTAPQVSFIKDTAVFDLPCVTTDISDIRKKIDNDHFMRAIKAAYKKGGIILLGYADQGFRVMSTNKPVEKASDFRGQKIRTMENPFQLRFWKKLGTNPTPMTFSEVYIGLQQKTIDAQENPYEVIVSNRLYEMQDYIVETNHLPHLISLIVSDKFFSSLTKEDQNILIAAEKKARDVARKASDDRIEERKEIIRQSGTTIITLDEDVRSYMKDSAYPIYKQIKNRVDPLIYELYVNSES